MVHKPYCVYLQWKHRIIYEYTFAPPTKVSDENGMLHNMKMHFSSIWCKEHTIEKSFKSKYFPCLIADLLIHYTYITLRVHKPYCVYLQWKHRIIYDYTFAPPTKVSDENGMLHNMKMHFSSIWCKELPAKDKHWNLKKPLIEKALKVRIVEVPTFKSQQTISLSPQVDNISSSSSSSNDNWIAYKP